MDAICWFRGIKEFKCLKYFCLSVYPQLLTGLSFSLQRLQNLKLLELTCCSKQRPKVIVLANLSLCLTKDVCLSKYCIFVWLFSSTVSLTNSNLPLKLYILDQILKAIALWASIEAHQHVFSGHITAEIVTENKWKPNIRLQYSSHVVQGLLLYNINTFSHLNAMNMCFVLHVWEIDTGNYSLAHDSETV